MYIGGVVEKIEGEPFEVDQTPHVIGFTFDGELLHCAENRTAYWCEGCPASVTLRGVVDRGTATCRRCNRLMVTILQ